MTIVVWLVWAWLTICCPCSWGQFAYDEEGAEEILEHLRTSLGARTLRRIRGGMGGGCVNTGQGFIIDNKIWVQIKCNYNDKVARPMFEGEMYGLNLLRSLNLPYVKIAKTYKVIDLPYWKGGACLVIEFFNTDVLNLSSERQIEVAKALAHLHLHNKKLKHEQPERYVSQFGFNVTTYCGRIPQDNSWKDNWLDFMMNNRIEYQLNLLKSKPDNQEPYTLWEFKLKHHVHKLFENITVEPALLHGDFWCNNAGLNLKTNESYIFDPACFYGHHEYDLAIAHMFGGFDDEFFDTYHSIIPKEPGYEDRQKFYQIFHYLNHWNQYGIGYYHETVDTMKDLCFALKLQGVDYKKIDDELKDYKRMEKNDRPVFLRTKNTNIAALFNTTRKRGRYANMTKSTTTPSMLTKKKTSFVKISKNYEPTTLNMDGYTGTTLSWKQIQQIFYAQEGFDWK